MSPYFSMHLKWILFASLSIFAIIEETTSLKEALMLQKDNKGMPLAVIVTKEGDSTKLQLAKPREHKENRAYVAYDYDDSKKENEDEPKQKFMLACPLFYSPAEKKWLESDATSSESRLFFLGEYTSSNLECLIDLVPSIKKIQKKENESERKYCSKSESEMYEVGYPVSSNSEGTDIQFLPVYKICHSRVTGKGATLYSIHRIEAPSLLFRRPTEELPELNPWKDYHKSFLDKNLSAIKLLQDKKKNYFAYQFVEIDNISTRSLEPTTKFLFNYTPITKNVDLFKGMIRADFFIRLYSKKNDKPLTLYSGTYQKRIEKNTGPVGCISQLCRSAILIESFWRIITDDDGNAIILVTQHTQRECGEAFLCEKNRKIKTYENGGCIYTCSQNYPFNFRTLHLLDLPELEINGDLDFTFQIQEAEPETNSPDGRESSNTISFKKIGIIDFLNMESFMEGVRSIDADIASDIDERFQPAWRY